MATAISPRGIEDRRLGKGNHDSGSSDVRFLPKEERGGNDLGEGLSGEEIVREPATDLGQVFVGREAEIHSLTSHLLAARLGGRRIVLLGGEPGVGKTRLLDEFSARASAEGTNVLWGRCWEEGGAPAYWPWVQAFRGLTSNFDTKDLTRWAGTSGPELAKMLPDIRRLIADLPEPGGSFSEEARFRMFDAFDGFLTTVSQEHPLLVVLEDVHSADAPSLLLLRFIASEAERGKLMVIASYRTTELTREHPLAAAIAEIERVPSSIKMLMKGLSPGDARDLVVGLARFEPPDDVLGALHRETDGNPLYIGEVVRLLNAEGTSWHEVDTRRWPIPEGVRKVIGRRVERLSDDCRRLLTLGAVIGRDFHLKVLQQVTGSTLEALLDSLEEAIAARLISELPQDPGTFRFSHGLMRDALYEDLMPSERMSSHATVGAALEQIYGQDLDSRAGELARHWFETGPAGDTEKVVEYSLVAGKGAVSTLAYEEAARLFRMALQAMRDSPNDERRCEVLILLGDAQRRSGDEPSAKETFLEAAEIATRLNSDDQQARAALGYAWHYPWVRAGVDRHIVPLLRQALGALPEHDSILRVRLLARLAGALRDQPSFEPRVSIAREAIEMARRIGDSSALGHALLAWWGASFSPDTLHEYHALADELDALRDEIARDHVMFTPWVRVVQALTTGEVWATAPLLEQSLSLAQERREPSDRYFALLMSVVLALHHGRLREVETLIEEMTKAGEQAQGWDLGASRLFALFALRRAQGRLAELEEDLRRAPSLYPGYRWFRCAVLILLCEDRRLGEAKRLFDQLAVDDFAAFPKDNEFLSALTLLAEAAVILEDTARACVIYDKLLPYAHLFGVSGWELPTGPVSWVLGMLAGFLQRDEDAARHFQDAIVLAETAEAPQWVAHSMQAHAAMLVARGRLEDRARAVELLNAASNTAQELEMVGLKGRVAELMSRLGVQVTDSSGRVADHRMASLTPRERETAGLVAEGLSNRQIAERLVISERTAETHVQNILTKLGFNSRAQVAGWVSRQGLGDGT